MIKNKIKKSKLVIPLKFIYGKFFYYKPIRLRYGKAFVETWNLLNESEFWNEEKIREYQLKQLKNIIAHAYKNVPYYTKLFNRYSINPDDIKDLEDIKKIPYLTKDIINQHKDEMIDKNFPKKFLGYGTTGGSTGIPMGFYYDKRLYASVEWAYMTHQWKRVGYKHRDKCVVLRGNVVNNIIENKKYWEVDWANNWLIMSSYHLTDETIPLYIKKIREFKPKFIQAYPSALQILVSYMKQNNIEPFESVKAIFCGSENIYDWQRELFEKVLKTRVYSWYGHSERVCLAGECEKSHYYHAFPQYGYLELINDKGEWCSKENEKCEIVATGFTNYVMPFIRYKTQDIAINTNKKCECGRNWKLIKYVEGRLQELIITNNDRLISMTAINMHSDVFDNVKQFQFHQKEKGKVVFNIVKKDTYSDQDTEYIRNELMKKLGSDMELNIKFVNTIPRTKSGKYRFLIQELPIKFGDR